MSVVADFHEGISSRGVTLPFTLNLPYPNSGLPVDVKIEIDDEGLVILVDDKPVADLDLYHMRPAGSDPDEPDEPYLRLGILDLDDEIIGAVRITDETIAGDFGGLDLTSHQDEGASRICFTSSRIPDYPDDQTIIITGKEIKP